MVKTRRMVSSTDGAEAVQNTTTTKTGEASGSTATTTTTTFNSITSSVSSTASEEMVNQLLLDASITNTKTKAGWCLRQGLAHIVTADEGRMFDLVKNQGPPSFYHSLKACRHEPTDNIKAPEDCFQSLCRIIAGQQLAGKAAQAIWRRLLDTTNQNLGPDTILQLAGDDGNDIEHSLQKPAGLSKAKARSILDLAHHFDTNQLSENMLTDPQNTEEQIREALLKVKGLGPWSCDMFIMFHLEKANVFPFGDLGVRKGVAKIFRLQGKGPKGSLCQKKDLDRATKLVEPYRPYQSLFSYYMWRAADIKDVYGADPKEGKKEDVTAHGSGPVVEEEVDAQSHKTTSSTTPRKVGTRKRKAQVVTP